MPISDFLKKHKRKLLALGLAGTAGAIGANIGYRMANNKRDKEYIRKSKIDTGLKLSKYPVHILNSIPDGIDDFMHATDNKTIKQHIVKRIGKNLGSQIARDFGPKLISKLVYRKKHGSQIKQMRLEDRINTGLDAIDSAHSLYKTTKIIHSLMTKQ